MRNILHKLCTDHAQQILEIIGDDTLNIRRSLQNAILDKIEDSYEKDFLGLIARGHFNIIDSIFIRLALRKHYLDATRNAFYISRVFENT